MISSQSYSEPVPLDYELNKCFSGFFFPPSLRWNRMLELSGVGYYLCTCVCVCAHTCMHTHVLSQVWFFVNPMDYSPPGSSVHGIFQAAILEWSAISFSRGSSQPRDQAQVSRIVGRRFTVWATREVLSCIFLILVSRLFICNSNLFSRFWIIFTIIIWNSLSGRFPISSSFVWFGGHLSFSFTCWVFLCLFILFKLLSLGCPFCILAVCGVLFIVAFPRCVWVYTGGLSNQES